MIAGTALLLTTAMTRSTDTAERDPLSDWRTEERVVEQARRGEDAWERAQMARGAGNE